ncbi:MAG: hypothetical protein JKZ03_05525 [Flavobacteriaceae bacterium]|nr:hypothetical protein [Flavobacteriaceae bacterium]MBL4887900.1 hypothetical protein [Flavobacteriaceae bacterium]
MKKVFVLGFLFFLPITVYLFFASGVNHFARLPVLTTNVSELEHFKTLDQSPIKLQGNITVLGFLGSDLPLKNALVFNLAHKIYKPYYQFHDLQFVMIVSDSMQPVVKDLKLALKKIEDPIKWKFIYGDSEAISSQFKSLKTNLQLNANLSSDFVFIIDKDKNLRGRDDDEDVKTLFGYSTTSIAELNDKMNDDIKVILAEYRLALKKYNKEK